MKEEKQYIAVKLPITLDKLSIELAEIVKKLPHSVIVSSQRQYDITNLGEAVVFEVVYNRGMNFLQNSDFSQFNSDGSFKYWTTVNKKWKKAKEFHSIPYGTAAEMDQDTGKLPDGTRGKVGWLMNDEDTLSQEVVVTPPHTSV